MYSRTNQHGFVSIFFSCGSKPLATWSKTVKNGYIRRLTDEDIKSLVLEIRGSNVVNTYITCPCDPRESLGIKLPYLVMLVKSLNKYFSFEITVLDDKNMKRRFRISNYQSTTRVQTFTCNMPIALNPSWNQVQFHLPEFTRQAFSSAYIETVRMTVNANCRLRRIYFTDRLRPDEELPQDYKLYCPP